MVSDTGTSDLKIDGKGLWSTILVIAIAAFLYLPIRLVEGAVPEWRPLQWALGIIVVGVTLMVLYLAKGRTALVHYAFPICLIFVAIPWPSPIENLIIQKLTQLNVSMVIEVMGLLGYPALQHGNVIEVGTGVVGVDDACSGIRSFQSSLMISLVLGELYRLTMARRLLLVPAGFLVAFGLNVIRTTILTWLAAKEGVEAIAKYHDQAGLTITIICTFVLWGLSGLLLRGMTSRKQKVEIGGSDPKDSAPLTVQCPLSATHSPPATGDCPLVTNSCLPSLVLLRLSFVLLVWLLFVEVGVYGWYRIRESRLTPGPTWSFELPSHDSSFKAISISPATFDLLRYDKGEQGQWRGNDGSEWQAFYAEWYPGRVAGYLAKRHTPEICLPATGRKMTLGPELIVLNIHGIDYPVRRYVFTTPNGPLHVFHCRWEVGNSSEAFVEQESARLNLIRAIWAGRGNHGQKVFELFVRGYDDPEKAKDALIQQLNKLIKPLT